MNGKKVIEKKNFERIRPELIRYFKLYYIFCTSPGEEALGDLLESAYRLNERLRKQDSKAFFNYMEFHVLKALRNLYTHEDDLNPELKGLHPEIFHMMDTDVITVCLIPEMVMQKALKGVRKDHVTTVMEHIYPFGGHVDIHPFIFNFSVRVFELTESLCLEIDTPFYNEIKESYDRETRYKLSHYIHYVDFRNNGVITEKEFEDYLVPVDEVKCFIDNKMEQQSEPLIADRIDFDALFDNFIPHMISLNGRAFWETYNIEPFEKRFENSCFTPVLNFFKISPKKAMYFIIQCRILMEAHPNPSEAGPITRKSELMRKQQIIANFIEILLNRKNKKNLCFLYYCAALVTQEFINEPGPEGEEIKNYIAGILNNNSKFNMHILFNKLKKKKNYAFAEHLKKVIWIQVVEALIEYQFEKFLIPID